jgi:hypothetical protein
VQVWIINKDVFLAIAMDLVGNIKVLAISVKMFMEQVVKVSVSAIVII